MFGVPDQIPSQPSRIPSQSVRVSGSPGVPVTDPSQPAAELDPLLVRAMPFSPPNNSASWPSGAFHYHKGVGPQGHRQARATEPAPEAPRRIPRWAAWRCGFDSRGRPRVVHPRAHERSAPHGADSGEARVPNMKQELLQAGPGPGAKPSLRWALNGAVEKRLQVDGSDRWRRGAV